MYKMRPSTCDDKMVVAQHHKRVSHCHTVTWHSLHHVHVMGGGGARGLWQQVVVIGMMLMGGGMSCHRLLARELASQ